MRFPTMWYVRPAKAQTSQNSIPSFENSVDLDQLASDEAS